MDTKRVILFIDSLGTGGAQRQIVNLAIGLKRKNINPLLLFYNNQSYFNEILLKYEIETAYIKRTNIFDIVFLINFYKLLKKHNNVWIISFLFMPSFYALFVKLFYPRLNIIVSERSFEQKTKLFEKIFPRNLYFLSTYITANSITQANVLYNKYPQYLNRIKYIPNGVINQTLIYDCNNIDFNIVSIGRVSLLKDTKLLIKAVAALKTKYSGLNLNVYWIGAKYDINAQDVHYYEECTKLVEFYHLKSIWNWSGQISNVHSILRNASILVHMSAGEGFPNAICESMSFGIPVIASNVMDHPKIIINNYNGYLVDTGDLNGLVSAFNTFLSLNIEERKKISQRAYDTATESFSLEKMVNSYYNLLNN